MDWPGYHDVLLPHADLKAIVEHPVATGSGSAG
jgi:hypothetical protein